MFAATRAETSLRKPSHMSSLLALNVLDPHSLLSAFGHSASATGSHAGVSGDAVEEHDTGLHDLLEGDPER